MNKSNYKNKTCRICGKVYKPVVGTQVTCGARCRLENRKHQAPVWARRYKNRLRKEIIAGYGGKCKCCGESIFEFLALDHVNNDGAKHRKELFGNKHGYVTSRPVALCLWIKRNKYPDTIQLLCHNCNNAKGYYGYCPHKLYAGNFA